MIALAKIEQSALAECESIIERGLDSFVEVGNALLRICNERLYRSEFGTFQEYCEAKWEMSDRNAYRMIEAAEVAENLQTRPIGPKDSLISSTLPSSESQIRPLKKLPPTQQREAWSEAVATAEKPGRPTAKEVTAVVDRISLPQPIRVGLHGQITNSVQLQLAKQAFKKLNDDDRRTFLKWANDLS